MLPYHKPLSKNTLNFPKDDFPSKDFISDIVLFFKSPGHLQTNYIAHVRQRKGIKKVVRDFIGSPAEVRKVT